MAISSVNTSAWTEITTDLATVAIPGTPQAGDRMLLLVTWKDFSRTLTVSGWTSCGAAFADGSVGSGNGTGSMKVQAFYRDWQSGDANPVLDWDATTNLLAGAIVNLIRKAADEEWSTPLLVTAAWPSSSSQTISASSTVLVPDGAFVRGLIGLRNDTVLFTRTATTGIDAASGVTWNGNYTESPGTHRTSTTGNDGAADSGLRLVTSGGSGITLRQTATISTAETGAALWIVQAVRKEARPAAFSIAWTGFAPTVSVSAGNVTVTPGSFALAWAGLAPTVTASDHKSVTPASFALTFTGFAPAVTASNHQTVTPAPFTLAWTGLAPTVTTGAGVVVTPNPFALAFSGFAPAVAISNHQLVTPNPFALAFSGFAPSVLTPLRADPLPFALAWIGMAPTVTATGGAIVGGLPPRPIAAMRSRPSGTVLAASPAGTARSAVPAGSATHGRPS